MPDDKANGRNELASGPRSRRGRGQGAGGSSGADARVAALAKRLRELRLERGFETAQELRDASGVSVSYISKIERGMVKRPSLEILSKLATALGVTVQGLYEVKHASGAYTPNGGDASPLPPVLGDSQSVDRLKDKLRQLPDLDPRRAQDMESSLDKWAALPPEKQREVQDFIDWNWERYNSPSGPRDHDRPDQPDRKQA